MLLMVLIDAQRRHEEERVLRRTLTCIRQCGIDLIEVHASAGRDESVDALVTDHALTLPMPAGWLQRRRVRDRLLRALGRDLPTVIASFGHRAAAAGVDAATALDCPLLVEVWQASQVRTPPVKPGRVSGYFTSADGLGEGLRQLRAHDLVATIPYPVDLPEPTGSTSCDPSITVLDAAPFNEGVARVLGGIARVVERYPSLQICLELGERDADGTWQRVDELGLLDRVSSVRNATEVAALASDSTLTILASESWSSRSIVDLAMARGRVVVRGDQAFLTEDDRRHQCVVLEPSVESWSQSLLGLLDDPGRCRTVGTAARDWIGSRNAADHVGRTWQQLLDEVSENVIYPFDSKRTSDHNEI